MGGMPSRSVWSAADLGMLELVLAAGVSVDGNWQELGDGNLGHKGREFCQGKHKELTCQGDTCSVFAFVG